MCVFVVESEAKLQSALGTIVCADCATMEEHGIFYYRQSEAGASLFVARASFLYAVETLKYSVEVVGGNAFAGVVIHKGIVGEGLVGENDMYFRVAACIANAVFNEVAENAVYQTVVAVDVESVGEVGVECHAVLRNGCAKFFSDFFHYVVNADCFARQ